MGLEKSSGALATFPTLSLDLRLLLTILLWCLTASVSPSDLILDEFLAFAELNSLCMSWSIYRMMQRTEMDAYNL